MKNKKINLNTIKKVHFIGIGGIGVSAIARMMLLSGKNEFAISHFGGRKFFNKDKARV